MNRYRVYFENEYVDFDADNFKTENGQYIFFVGNEIVGWFEKLNAIIKL
jgi:hypothetical protein